MRARLISGANLLVYLNGRLFGRCTGMSWVSSTPHGRIHTIDDPQAAELTPTTVDVSWKLSSLRVVGDGGMQGVGAVAPGSRVIRDKYFTLQVVERISQRAVFQSDFNCVDTESWGVPAKGFMTGEVMGQGLAWVNETS